MRLLALALISVTSLIAAKPSIEALWADLAAKRAALKTFHQEFDVSNSLKTSEHTQGSKRTLILDWSQGLWQSKAVAGSGDFITIFNGTDLLHTEKGSDEFTRAKRNAHDDDPPVPAPYALTEPDWAKAKELARQPCGLPGVTHECVILDIPLKPRVKSSGSHMTNIAAGDERIVIDTVTGLLLQSHSAQPIDTGSVSYVSETTYSLRRFGSGMPLDAALFKIPDGLSEVKELSRWDAPRIKKMLAGSPAPTLSVKDIHGNPLTLDSLKGKTVLLDFWTTWCPPCRADAPSIDKLYQKYGATDLAIVGFSVDEDRAIVEKFLGQHPHDYPIILTSENEMPRPYQIGVFPTYIVIEKDGSVSSATQGEKGFGDLKKLLKKAGLESE